MHLIGQNDNISTLICLEHVACMLFSWPITELNDVKQTQIEEWTNQNSKKNQAAFAKRGKTRPCLDTLGFGFARDWLKNQKACSNWLEHVTRHFFRQSVEKAFKT